MLSPRGNGFFTTLLGIFQGALPLLRGSTLPPEAIQPKYDAVDSCVAHFAGCSAWTDPMESVRHSIRGAQRVFLNATDIGITCGTVLDEETNAGSRFLELVNFLVQEGFTQWYWPRDSKMGGELAELDSHGVSLTPEELFARLNEFLAADGSKPPSFRSFFGISKPVTPGGALDLLEKSTVGWWNVARARHVSMRIVDKSFFAGNTPTPVGGVILDTSSSFGDNGNLTVREIFMTLHSPHFTTDVFDLADAVSSSVHRLARRQHLPTDSIIGIEGQELARQLNAGSVIDCRIGKQVLFGRIVEDSTPPLPDVILFIDPGRDNNEGSQDPTTTAPGSPRRSEVLV
jgi:hypothetical protein